MRNYYSSIVTVAVLIWMAVSLLTVVLSAWFGSRANVGSTADAGVGHGIYLIIVYVTNAIPTLILGAVLTHELAILWQGRPGLWFFTLSAEAIFTVSLMVAGGIAVFEGGSKVTGLFTTTAWLTVGLAFLMLARSASSTGDQPFSMTTAFSGPVLLRLVMIICVSIALTLTVLRWSGPSGLFSWPALNRAGLTGMPRHPAASWSIYGDIASNNVGYVGRLQVADGKLFWDVNEKQQAGQKFVHMIKDLKRQTWEAPRLDALKSDLKQQGYWIQDDQRKDMQ